MPATYTVKQVAEILGYSTNSIYTFLKEKRIKGVRVGKGRFRIPQSELDRLLLTTKTKGGTSQRKSQEVIPLATEIPSILQIAHPSGVVEQQHGYSPITGLIDGFGRRAVDVPSLFDWYIGISSIVLGFSLALFSRLFEEVTVVQFLPWMSSVRVSFILGGFGLLFTDIIGESRSRWHITFHAVLAASYAALAFIMLGINDGDAVMLFGLLSVTMIVTYLLGMGGIGSLSLYLWFLTLLPPFVHYVWPLDFNVPPLWSVFAPVHPGLFLGFWTAASAIEGWLLWWGYHKKRLVFWIIMGLSAAALVATSVWYATNSFWIRSFFTLVLGVFTLFSPVWGAFRFAHKKDRRLVFSLFGYLLMLFIVGINIIRFMQTNVLEFASNQYLNKVNYGRVVVETTLTSVKMGLESAAQNQLLVSAIAKEDTEVIGGILRGLYEGSLGVRRLLAVTLNGDILASYPLDESLVGQNIAYREYFTNAVLTKKTFISDVFESIGSSPRAVVAFAVPFIGSDSEVTGILIGSLDLDYLGDRLQQIASAKDGEYFTVVDRTGKRLIHPKKELIGTMVTADNAVIPGVSAERGIHEWATFDGIRSLQAYDTIGLTRWGIAIHAPLLAVLAPTRTSSLVLFAMILVSVGLISVFLLLYQARSVRMPESR